LQDVTNQARIALSQHMTKHWLLYAVPLLFVLSYALRGQQDSANFGPWSGVIVNSDCTADEGFAESAKCTENRGPAAKLSLYDDTVRAVYTLDPQDQAVGHLGDAVTVEGTRRNNAIQVASIKMLTAIGLGVGQKAPAFSARDQFGQEQSLAKLRGPKGTVLLFFRSADW
jgi:hypothetical protein